MMMMDHPVTRISIISLGLTEREKKHSISWDGMNASGFMLFCC